jgi:ribosomal protein L37AE/L43A
VYLIARCPSCGKHIMANTANKTRTCPHCGFKAELFSLRVLGRAETGQDAVRMIQRLKEMETKRSPGASFKRFKA